MKHLLQQANEAMPPAFMESIKLKISMLSNLRIVILCFFCPKFLQYLYEAINPDDDFQEVRFNVATTFLDAITFSFLLFVFRPRKQWPDFFSLGLGGLALEAQRRGQPVMDLGQVISNMVPIYISKINNNFLQKGNVNRSLTSDGSFSSFGSADENATLLIMNPNEFTLNPDDNIRSTVLNDSSEGNEEIRNPYKEEEEMNKVIFKIQKTSCVAVPEKKHWDRIKQLKKAGLYVSTKRHVSEDSF